MNGTLKLETLGVISALAGVAAVALALRLLLPETTSANMDSFHLAIGIAFVFALGAFLTRMFFPSTPLAQIANRSLAGALFAAFGVAVFATTLSSRTDTPQLASVRLHEILEEHITAQASEPMSGEQRLTAASSYAKTFDAAVRSLSDRDNLVILSAEAVVSGTHDVTDALRKEIARQLGE